MKWISGAGWLAAGAIAVAAAGSGLAGAALAQHAGLGAMHGMGHDMASMDPAAMDVQFDRHIAEMVPDATADQKAKLKAIATRVHADLGAVHSQLRQAHQQAHGLLLAPTIDRARLERLRAEQLRRFDAASRRMVEALADAAEVLTPEQRSGLATRLQSQFR